jgi:hypothetical protein
MAGGLSSGAVGRLEALEDGDEVAAFLRAPASRGRHEQRLGRAWTAGEPAGQIAARELEVQRISGALRRAAALDDDVATAIEAA